MEDTEDFSSKETKTVTSDKLGRKVPIPPKTSDTTIEEVPPSINEEEEVIAVVKRRLDSVLSRKLHEK